MLILFVLVNLLLTTILSLVYLSFVVFSCFSKSGRPPLKKLSDRKAFASLGHLSSNGSPDCAGIVLRIHWLVFFEWACRPCFIIRIPKG